MQTESARQIFDAMPAAERRNLTRLGVWFEPGYRRKWGEHLVGPEYGALRMRGVISDVHISVMEGKKVVITDLGRAVLHFIEAGYEQ